MMVRSRAGAVVVAGVLLSALSACGSGSAGTHRAEDHDTSNSSAAADVSTCSGEARAAAKPYGDGFPRDWPFPPRSVVFHAEDRGSDGTIVTAVSGLAFSRVLRFMNHGVVAGGFRVEQGETEAHDAEAEWRGNGFRGRWAIRESAGCPGETVIQVLSARR